MEIEVIKSKEKSKNIKTGQLYASKIKVAAYARVSTEHEEQQTSFKSQKEYYIDKITRNPNWTFVGIYADEGISGTNDFKREQFMKMIKDAEDGKIDLILTKSISRFARNTLDTLKYVRLLKDNKVAIIFEEENINTLDMAGELLLTVLSSVAQQESETISSHIKLGIRMKRERGEIVGFKGCYGYRYDSKNKKMNIIESEAKVVRFIFKKYLMGYGTDMIARILNEKGIGTPGGKGKWRGSKVMNLIKNEKYKGDVIQGKSITTNAITHKRDVNRGQEDKYIMKNHHEPIVSREDWDKADKIRKERNNIKTINTMRCKREFVFTEKMVCGFCGNKVGRRKAHKDMPNWECMSVYKGARLYCQESKPMKEVVLEKAFMEGYHLLTEKDGLAIEEFINIIRENAEANSVAKQIEKAYELKKEYKEKLSKLIDVYVDGKMDLTSFNKKQQKIKEEIERIQNKIDEFESDEANNGNLEDKMINMKDKLLATTGANMFGQFDPEIFLTLVDYVILGGYDENGNKDSYLLRFICRKDNNFEEKKITSQMIVNNNSLQNEDTSIYMPILDFISNQKIFTYNVIDGIRRRDCTDGIRVRFEVEK